MDVDAVLRRDRPDPRAILQTVGYWNGDVDVASLVEIVVGPFDRFARLNSPDVFHPPFDTPVPRGPESLGGQPTPIGPAARSADRSSRPECRPRHGGRSVKSQVKLGRRFQRRTVTLLVVDHRGTQSGTVDLVDRVQPVLESWKADSGQNTFDSPGKKLH